MAENSQDSRNYSREFMIEFIEMYKSLPEIWKVKSKEYSDRTKKMSAYNKLAEKLKVVEANADREMVIKKINNIRSSYRRELKKVRLSMKSGAGSDDVYTPTLWYFDLLSFLCDQETPREIKSSLNDSLVLEVRINFQVIFSLTQLINYKV